MLLSAVSVLVVAQSSSEIPEGLMNNPVFLIQHFTFINEQSKPDMASLFVNSIWHHCLFSLWRYVGCGCTSKCRKISNLCSQTIKEAKEGGAISGFIFILFTFEYWTHVIFRHYNSLKSDSSCYVFLLQPSFFKIHVDVWQAWKK